MDLPTSYAFAKENDDFQNWVLAVINSMILDILAATARKDRRRRQA